MEYSHAVRVSPQMSNRMIDASRSVLNRYIPDLYLYSDVYKGEESGKWASITLCPRVFIDELLNFCRSPGYALSLLAESTTGALYCAERTSRPGVAPEDVALEASRALLSEVQKRGCIDRQHQTLVLLLMMLGSEDIGRCRLGQPTPRT